MDSILALLRFIDFWTIVGAVGSTAAAVIAVFALPRLNRRSEAQARTDALKLQAEAVEVSVRQLMASLKIEGAQWNIYASGKPSGWKPDVTDFEKRLAGTMGLHRRVASDLAVLFQFTAIKAPRYSKLTEAGKRLAMEVDRIMTFHHPSYALLADALDKFTAARGRV